MPLSSGTRIGVYQVTAKIGAGGMGEVWQARDTKLDRDVALKVLPEAFTSDPERLARFEREAKVLASLNHPNIGSIYGLEESEGVRALVLELVEGPTLAERIAEGAIPVDEALPIAKQIADALEAAHARGVIHRDLKPANVKVKADGMVKVLDFGLAKALEREAVGDPSESPTRTAAATRAGVIMGTAAYMSPEQARGKPLDKRTDIWSFGCVLYEILTGHRAFGNETAIDTISAILGREPDWRLVPEAIPAGVRRLLRRCLEKDSRRRLHDVADARIELEDLERKGPETEDFAPAERRTVDRSWFQALLPWALVVGLGVLAATLWLARSGGSPSTPGTAHLSIELPAGHLLAGQGRDYPLALSPDGRRLAYVADDGGGRTTRLFLRHLDDPTVRQVPDTVGARYPFFSPDGESVGFWADGWLQRVPFSGGQPLRITAVSVLDLGAAWGPDDTIVFASSTGGLQRVSVTDGTPEQLLDAGRWPVFLDDGRLLFSTGRGRAGNEIQVLDLETLERQQLYASPEPVRQAKVLPSGHLLYGSAGRVIALPLDPETLEVAGTPLVVLEDVLEGGNAGAVLFDVAVNGTVVFVPGGTQHSLVLVDRSGAATLLDDRRAAYRSPSLSPDGRLLAVTIDADPDPSDIWIFDIERGSWRRFTLSAHNLDPHWTPGGSSLSFCSARGRGVEPFLQPLADGAATPLLPDEAVTRLNQCLHSWSPDASSFLFHEIHPERGFDLWLLDRSGPEPRVEEWLVTPFHEAHAQISPDGRWVAYSSNETGQAEVYVQPFRSGGQKVSISTGGGTGGQWRGDGRELFYRSGGQMMAVDVLDGPSFAIGEPEMLFADVYHNSGLFNYAAFPDGDRFLMIEPDPRGDRRHLEVILNWHQELLERVPVE